MARLPVTLAAATLALAFGAPLAHAQMSGSGSMPDNMGAVGSQTTGKPSTTRAMSPSMRGNMSGSATEAPAVGSSTTGYPGTSRGMPAPMPGGSTPQGSMPGYGQSSGSMSGSGMGGSGMGGSGMSGSGGSMGGQGLSGVNLPKQNVGNGAYNGGGVILEQQPDGTMRVVR